MDRLARSDSPELRVAAMLTWVIQRRVVLAERVERLRKELAEAEAAVARLAAAAAAGRCPARGTPAPRSAAAYVGEVLKRIAAEVAPHLT
ncbi:hypothetical protein [Streptomyces sp. NPDC046727]|uniref:hypothetical protein n=1 Tax=Streptomyces sp. NPDC046727 TaxID=3155373 RepID=UPI0033F2E5EB